MWGAPRAGPFKTVSGILSNMPFIKRSLSSAIFFCQLSMFIKQISVATPNPAMPGKFSVPERSPASWPPPCKRGAIRTLSLINRAPIPLGP